jgi:hypothetical protein
VATKRAIQEKALEPSYAQSLISRALALNQTGSLPEDACVENEGGAQIKTQLADFLLKLGNVHSAFGMKINNECSPILTEDHFLKAEINFHKAIGMSPIFTSLPLSMNRFSRLRFECRSSETTATRI